MSLKLVAISEVLHLILVLLLQLVDLVLDLFFANDRLTLIILETLENSFMVLLHLILLLLLLLKLQFDEF